MNWIIIGTLALAASVGTYFYWPDDDARLSRAIGTYDCEAAPIAPTFGKGYEGSLIDAHMHMPHPPEGPEFLDMVPIGNERPQLGRTVTVSDYICNLKTEGIKKAFIFFPVFPGAEELHLAVVDAAINTYPEVLVPFIMPPERDDQPDGYPTVDAATLEEWLSVYPDLFEGYGEIGLYARGDNWGPTGAPELPPDSERLTKIYPVVRKNNLLVYFHLGRGQQASFERTAAANPDISFIFHGDQLIPYGERGQDLSAIDAILYRHPNVTYEVDELYGDVWLVHPEKDKEEFFAHFENYEELLEKDLGTWKAFIERHPDQVIWGSDRGVSNLWSMDRDVGLTLTRYVRAFIARLDPAVQEKYAFKNAERLIAE